MTPADLKSFRAVHSLTQSGLGAIVGRSGASVTKWECGKVAIPSWVQCVLDAWLARNCVLVKPELIGKIVAVTALEHHARAKTMLDSPPALPKPIQATRKAANGFSVSRILRRCEPLAVTEHLPDPIG